MVGLRRARRLAAAAFCVLVLNASPAGPSVVEAPCPASPFLSAEPLVIAHASSTYFGPPNTLEMERAAVAAGADIVDADVRMTADGVLVAAHDDDLRSTTDGTGSLARTSWADLRKLDDAWTWKAPNGQHALRGHGVRVPTIEHLLVAFPHRKVGLEFKVVGAEHPMCALLRRLHRTGDVFISSNYDAAVDRFRTVCPEVTTTVTDALVLDMRQARATRAPWCSPAPISQPPYRPSSVNADSVRWNHEHGMAVFTWVIDDTKTLKALSRTGVDAVYTGRSDRARAIFDKAFTRS